MRSWTILICAVLSVVLAGCLPEKRIIWSPDGQMALVPAKNATYITDTGGKLSKAGEPIVEATWMADSRHVIAESEVRDAKWSDVEKYLPDDQRSRVRDGIAKFMLELRQYKGEPGRFYPPEIDPGVRDGIILYLRGVRDQEMKKEFGPKWEELKKTPAVASIGLVEVRDGQFRNSRVLAFSLRGARAIALSPKGTTMAFVADDALYVAPIEQRSVPVRVDEGVAAFPDWAPDGQSLVYAKATDKAAKGLTLGTITRARVCDKDGNIIKEVPASREGITMNGTASPQSKPAMVKTPPFPSEDLAGVVLVKDMRIKCLRDGRVLFSSLEMQLPCTIKDMPQHGSLFVLDPARQATVTRIMPRQAESAAPDLLNRFELSPDQTRIIIPGRNGDVAVLTLATGEVLSLQKDTKTDKEWSHLPVWRNNQQVCMVVPPRSEHGARERQEVVLVTVPAGGEPKLTWKCISKDWPDSAVEGLLEKVSKPSTQPATAIAPASLQGAEGHKP